MKYYAQTMPGVEQITWLEIQNKLAAARFEAYLFAKDQNGIVVFDYQGPVNALLQLRTAEDVFVGALSLQKLSRDWGDLRRLTTQIAETAVFDQAIQAALGYKNLSHRPTYRVISRQYGRFQYRRKDVAAAAGKGIARRYPHWRQVDDNAQLEIWINVLGSRLLGGVRLSDRRMRHRFQKREEVAASLRPSIAAAMVFLTQPAPDDVFLDPMCGSGTLLMERRLAAPYRHLLAADIDAGRVRATRENFIGQRKERPSAKRPLPFTPLNADAQMLPFPAGRINKVAVNLPFGRQVGSPEMVATLYPAFFREVERVLVGNGRAVVLTSEFDAAKDAVRQCPTLGIVTGYSVAVLGQWGRIYIIEKDAQ